MDAERRFVLDGFLSEDDGYTPVINGYISFPSHKDYKKIKNINKTISRFLERRGEINKDEKVYKCLELIESLIEDCDVMRLDCNVEYTFNEAFPNRIEFIEKVGYNYDDNELVDVGVLFVNESKRPKEKYIKIVEKLYKNFSLILLIII